MNYTIAPFSIDELGRSGMSSISCKVKGYWSADTIRVYIQRDFVWEGGGWKVSVSYGSGGRDTKEVVSDTEAARYFAEALVAMCDLADSILEQQRTEGVLEKAHLAFRAELEAARQKELAAKQAKIDADEALGTARAKEIVAAMVERGSCTVLAFTRGEERPVTIELVTRYKAVFYVSGNRTGRADVIEYLAGCSVRTTFKQADSEQ